MPSSFTHHDPDEPDGSARAEPGAFDHEFDAAFADYRSRARGGVVALRRGLLLFMLGVVSAMASVIVTVVLGSSMGRGGATAPPPAAEALQLVSAAIGAVATFFYLRGWWSIAAEPPAAPTALVVGPRQTVLGAVRIIAIATVLSLPIYFVNAAAGPAGPGGPSTLVATLSCALLPALLAVSLGHIVLFFAAMAYMRRLARAFGDEKLHSSALATAWAVPFLYVPGACFLLVGPLVALALIDNVAKQLALVLDSLPDGSGGGEERLS